MNNFLGVSVSVTGDWLSVNTLQRAGPKFWWSEPPRCCRIHPESSGQDMPSWTWWSIEHWVDMFCSSILWTSCQIVHVQSEIPTWGDRSPGWWGRSRSSCAPPHEPTPGSPDQTSLPGSSLPVQNRLNRQIKEQSEETPTIVGWPKWFLPKRKNLLLIAVKSGGGVCWEGGGGPIDGDPRSCTGARRRTARPAEGGRGWGSTLLYPNRDHIVGLGRIKGETE